jgi:hypothetical protein
VVLIFTHLPLQDLLWQVVLLKRVKY